MTKPAKILLAEDEVSLGSIIKETLETKGFEVVYCGNGQIAESKYKSEKPDLLVLDVMMPIKDGFTLAKEIRADDAEIPIIFLTAKSQTKDVLDGFEHGCNDYIKKPFSLQELIVRINALLKRNNQKYLEKNLVIGQYQFNRTKQKLIFKDEVINLTHRESELLYHLSKKRNEIMDRSLILKKIWGDDDFFNARSMDVFISKLRKKLKKDSAVQILNIRGYGYKLVC